MAKKFLPLIFMICLMLLASPAIGQTGTDEDMVAAFSREAPLNQSDVDVYLEAFPLLKQADPAKGDVASVFTKAGLSEVRGVYVVVRIGQAYAVVEFENKLGAEAAESYRDSLDEVVRPTPEEVALVRKNKDKLDAAMAKW